MLFLFFTPLYSFLYSQSSSCHSSSHPRRLLGTLCRWQHCPHRAQNTRLHSGLCLFWWLLYIDVWLNSSLWLIFRLLLGRFLRSHCKEEELARQKKVNSNRETLIQHVMSCKAVSNRINKYLINCFDFVLMLSKRESGMPRPSKQRILLYGGVGNRIFNFRPLLLQATRSRKSIKANKRN
jgi:hypothetical protein